MKRRTTSLIASLVGLSLLTTTVPGFAETKGKPAPAAAPKKKALSKKDPAYLEAKRLFEKGEELYAKGDYEKAIEAWEISYDLTGADLILESISNAYERLGKFEKAREYLGRWRESAPQAEEVDLDARLKNLDARIATEKALQGEKDAKEKAEREAREKREAEERAKQQGGKIFIPGIVIGGVGVAAAIAGGVLDGIAYRNRPDAAAVCATSPEPDAKLLCRESARTAIEQSNTFATVGDILLIAGTATAAAGVVLFVVKSGGKKDEKKAAAVPWFLPGGGGMIVGGSF